MAPSRLFLSLRAGVKTMVVPAGNALAFGDTGGPARGVAAVALGKAPAAEHGIAAPVPGNTPASHQARGVLAARTSTGASPVSETSASSSPGHSVSRRIRRWPGAAPRRASNGAATEGFGKHTKPKVSPSP